METNKTAPPPAGYTAVPFHWDDNEAPEIPIGEALCDGVEFSLEAVDNRGGDDIYDYELQRDEVNLCVELTARGLPAVPGRFVGKWTDTKNDCDVEFVATLASPPETMRDADQADWLLLCYEISLPD